MTYEHAITDVHDDMDVSIWERIKNSNLHFVVISVISRTK